MCDCRFWLLIVSVVHVSVVLSFCLCCCLFLCVSVCLFLFLCVSVCLFLFVCVSVCLFLFVCCCVLCVFLDFHIWEEHIVGAPSWGFKCNASCSFPWSSAKVVGCTTFHKLCNKSAAIAWLEGNKACNLSHILFKSQVVVTVVASH